jgi:hypothetical protein
LISGCDLFIGLTGFISGCDLFIGSAAAVSAEKSIN